MQSELTLTTEAAARALAQSHSFLGHFLMPQSPSEVAAKLAHHHVRRLETLGLLRQERREAGKVYYRLTAQQFRVSRELLPPGDPDENAVRTLRGVSAEFLNANARSWSYSSGKDEGTVYGFGSAPHEVELPRIGSGSNEPHPTHLDALTLRLTPERYRKLALALSALLSEAYTQGQSSSGEVCTLTVLAFRDTRSEMQDGRGIARGTSTFLPWP